MFDPNSPIMNKIKNARSLKDLKALLGQIVKGNKDLDKSAVKLLKSVSAKVTETADYDNNAILNQYRKGNKNSTTKKKRGNSKDYLNKLDTFKNIDLKGLENSSKSLERFAQEIAELEAMRQVLVSGQFAALPKTKTLLKSVDASLKEAKASRNKQLKAMSLAITKKPKEVKKAVTNVAKHLDDMLDDDLYADQAQYSFLFVPEGRTDVVWYQTFITYTDLLSSGDFVFDLYTIVVTSSVDLTDGTMSHYLTTLKSDSMPGSFDPGREITTSSKAKQMINTFLTADDFDLNFSRKKSLGNPKEGDRFTRTEDIRDAMRGEQLGGTAIRKISEYVDSMRILNDQIYFRLVKGVDAFETKEAVDQIKNAVKDLYGAKRAKGIAHRVENSKGRTFVIVALIDDSQSRTNRMLENADRMAVRLGMTRSETSKFKQFIAREL